MLFSRQKMDVPFSMNQNCSLETHFYGLILLSHDLFPSQKERVKALSTRVSLFFQLRAAFYTQKAASPPHFQHISFSTTRDTTNKYNRGGIKVWMKKQEE